MRPREVTMTTANIRPPLVYSVVFCELEKKGAPAGLPNRHLRAQEQVPLPGQGQKCPGGTSRQGPLGRLRPP